ncbi:MAG: hypothetical protein LLG40_11540 [Deltaproteobacteria bacterium]|nr:hypothetical protein [Deltaproteobacteria bacterium]
MNNFMDECKKTILDVQKYLKEKKEWETRYSKYADAINHKLAKIKNNKTLFNEKGPLYLYMNVKEAKSSLKFQLRYLGQIVAMIKVDTNDKVMISTKPTKKENFEETNKRDFGCTYTLGNEENRYIEWVSDDAKIFRKHFGSNPKRSNESKKKNEEHRLESLLLTEFSKKRRSQEKPLCGIQPVKLAKIARFQMPTPLGGSNIKDIKYSNSRGGGIDILSHVVTNHTPKLCIMEVKDENVSKEPPAKVIQQGLAYATFIRELLRSGSGDKWWKILGFDRKLPEKIVFYVACVMPSKDQNDESFAGQIIPIPNSNDNFHLHYIYFQENNNNISNIISSLES